MCFSAAGERPGGVLALPNGFLKTLVTQRYADELDRYAASSGLERIEIVVDPAVSAVSGDSAREQPPEAIETEPMTVAIKGVLAHRAGAVAFQSGV